MPQSTQVKKLDFLTGLKGIACLMVSVNHFLGVFVNRDELGVFREWYTFCYIRSR